MKTKDYLTEDGYWDRKIEKLDGAEGERMRLVFCPDCGMIYSVWPGPDAFPMAPPVCEINGAGAVLVPLYAVYGKGFER